MKKYYQVLVGFAVGLSLGWVGLQKPASGQEDLERPRAAGLGLARSSQVPEETRVWIDAIRENGVPAEQSVLALSAVDTVPIHDIARVIDELHHLPAHSTRMVMKRQLLHRWSEHEPESALKWTLTHFLTMAGQLAESWYSRDPEDALAFAAQQPTESSRARLYGAMASSIVDSSTAEAVAFLQEHMIEDKKSYFTKALRKLARRDPVGLQSHLGNLPDRLQADKALASGWAIADPTAALAWAHGTEDSDLVAAVIGKIQDPQTALSAVGELPSEKQEDAIDEMTQVSRNPQAYLDLLDSATGLSKESIASLRLQADDALDLETFPEPKPIKSPKELVNELVQGKGNERLGTDPAQEGLLLEAMEALSEEEQVQARQRYFDLARRDTRFASAAAQIPYPKNVNGHSGSGGMLAHSVRPITMSGSWR